MLIVYFSDDFVHVPHIRKSKIVLTAIHFAKIPFCLALPCRLKLLKVPYLARFLI
jgi:hypothetical protein